jgi:hypothetical protein
MNGSAARKQRRMMEVSTEVIPAMESLLTTVSNPDADRTAVSAAADKVKSYLRLPADRVTLRQKRGFQVQIWVKVATALGAHPSPAAIRDWLLEQGVVQGELPRERMFRKTLRKLGYPPA